MSQRILLFESDGDFALEVSTKFEAIGATVDVVSDGTRGLELAAAHRPDLILLSIELPGMNGFLVCKKIKKQDGLENVPLLILSSEATEDVFEQHKKLRTRADDYIHKPVAFADLLERVKRFMTFDDIDASVLAQAEDEEDAIEIADLDDDDVILIDSDGALPEANQPAGAAEVRAFAETAFQSLVPDLRVADRLADGEAAPPATDESDAGHGFGGQEFATDESSSDAGQRQSSVAPQSIPPSDRLGRLEVELGRAERRARDAEQQMQAQSQRASAAERSLAEASKRGGASSREFLDLREQLNRKDRELLALRDQVSARDKQLLEANDKSLMFERELADRADKNLELHRELEKTRELVEALQTDKESAKKRFEDIKARCERTELKNRDVAKELDTVKATHARESTALAQRDAEARAVLEQRHAATAAALQQEHDATLAGLRNEHEAAIAELRETMARASSEAEREHELLLIAAHDRAERDKEVALVELRNGLSLRAEQELTALRQKHDAGLLQLRGELAAKGEQAVTAERAKHETALSQLRGELESAAAERLAEVERGHEAGLSRLRAELEAESARGLSVERNRNEQVLGEQRAALAAAAERSLAQAEAEHAAALARLHAELEAKAEQHLDEQRTEHAAALAAQRAELDANTETRLAEAAASHERDLQALRAELTSGFERRLAEDRAKHEAIISQALTAHELELTGTRQMLERKHASESDESRERYAQELARVNAALEELEGQRRSLQEQLAAAEATGAETAAKLSKIISERDQKSELVDHLQAQVEQAMRQRASEEQVLERARKALAIGLSLLEDHKDGQPS